MEEQTKISKLEKELIGFIGPSAFMIWSAIGDVGMTYLNLMRYGVEYEGNPIIRNLIDETSLGTGLIAPKAISAMTCMAVAASMDLTEKYNQKGKYLLYGAGLGSAIGFLTNWYFYFR